MDLCPIKIMVDGSTFQCERIAEGDVQHLTHTVKIHFVRNGVDCAHEISWLSA